MKMSQKIVNFPSYVSMNKREYWLDKNTNNHHEKTKKTGASKHWTKLDKRKRTKDNNNNNDINDNNETPTKETSVPVELQTQSSGGPILHGTFAIMDTSLQRRHYRRFIRFDVRLQIVSTRTGGFVLKQQNPKKEQTTSDVTQQPSSGSFYLLCSGCFSSVYFAVTGRLDWLSSVASRFLIPMTALTCTDGFQWRHALLGSNQ